VQARCMGAGCRRPWVVGDDENRSGCELPKAAEWDRIDAETPDASRRTCKPRCQSGRMVKAPWQACSATFDNYGQWVDGDVCGQCMKALCSALTGRSSNSTLQNTASSPRHELLAGSEISGGSWLFHLHTRVCQTWYLFIHHLTTVCCRTATTEARTSRGCPHVRRLRQQKF
jgi:hypothetical protein